MSYGLWGGRKERWSITCVVLSRAHINMIYHCWYWPWSPGWGSGSCSATKWFSPTVSAFAYCTLWKKESTAHVLGMGMYGLTLWGWNMYVNYLKIFCNSELPLLLHSFMYSIIYFLSVWTHEYLLCFGLWSNTTLFCSSYCSSFTNGSSFSCSFVPSTHPTNVGFYILVSTSLFSNTTKC